MPWHIPVPRLYGFTHTPGDLFCLTELLQHGDLVLEALTLRLFTAEDLPGHFARRFPLATGPVEAAMMRFVRKARSEVRSRDAGQPLSQHHNRGTGCRIHAGVPRPDHEVEVSLAEIKCCRRSSTKNPKCSSDTVTEVLWPTDLYTFDLRRMLKQRSKQEASPGSASTERTERFEGVAYRSRVRSRRCEPRTKSGGAHLCPHDSAVCLPAQRPAHQRPGCRRDGGPEMRRGPEKRRDGRSGQRTRVWSSPEKWTPR